MSFNRGCTLVCLVSVFVYMDMALCFFPLVRFAMFGCGSCGFWSGLDGLVWYLVYGLALFCFACSTFLSPGRLSDIVIVWDGGGVLLFLTM
jgi:hypothetical protein